MSSAMAVLRGLGAALVSAVISLIGFLLVGVFLPIWAMMLVYGKQNVQDAPAHGGVVLFVAMPIAGLLALCGFIFLTPAVYRSFPGRRAN